MERSHVLIALIFGFSCYIATGQICEISTYEETNSHCKKIREANLKKQRTFYKLTKSPTPVSAPLLDQPVNVTMGYFYTNQFESHCFNLQVLFSRKALRSTFQKTMNRYRGQSFTTYQDYFILTEYFKRSLVTYDKELQEYLKIPSSSYPFMKNLTKNAYFLSDDYFVDERLAGQNVMSLRRVTIRGKIGTNWRELKERLNPNFNWAEEVSKVTRRRFWRSLKERMVYVAEFPLLAGIKSLPDPLAAFFPSGVKMIPQTNPIAVFASRYNRRKRRYELKPVAIQIDDEQSSMVYTPDDGFNWQLAKASFQATDLFYGQLYEHLLRTHLRMEPVCVVLHRQLSEYHPLNELLKYHCRGLLAVNANGVGTLLGEKGLIGPLFGFGKQGGYELIRRGFKHMIWNDIGLEYNVKTRGMDDKKKVPYYPYRDDGIIIDSILRQFADEFVDIYYDNDWNVEQDQELMNFVNELSAKGKTPPDNGNGKVAGLPSHFTTKDQLSRFLAEALWVQVQHAVVSFTPTEYSSSVPLNPSKLYFNEKEPQPQNLVSLLAGPVVATIQTNLAFGVGTFHYDSLFDYGNGLRDEPMRNLVTKAYRELMHVVKPLLDGRNKRRLKRGEPTYPFVVPGWVPNSIST